MKELSHFIVLVQQYIEGSIYIIALRSECSKCFPPDSVRAIWEYMQLLNYEDHMP